jgi:superfamily II DNA or RNA helicase
LRLNMPNAGGLIIAPSVEIANYMADVLEAFEGERPAIVHNQIKNPEAKIAAFRNSDKKWLVSVAMVSEGVDIKRLRVLVYLPNARTELSFRQAMGRVVRTMGNDDLSRAYVVMPAHPIFELYATRVEREMGPVHAKDRAPTEKSCPVCEEKVPLNASVCGCCGHKWPENVAKLKPCHECEGLNPLTAKECMHCGATLGVEFDLDLNDALRVGAIVRGMEIDEADVLEAEELRDNVRRKILKSGDEKLIYIVKQLPEESWASLKHILNAE